MHGATIKIKIYPVYLLIYLVNNLVNWHALIIILTRSLIG